MFWRRTRHHSEKNAGRGLDTGLGGGFQPLPTDPSAPQVVFGQLLTGNTACPPQPTLVMRIARILALSGAGAGVLLAVLAFLWLQELRVFDVSPDDLAVLTKARPADNTLVYDRDGHKIGEFFTSYHVYVPYQQLPRSLVDAIIAVEDRNFWHHAGFDPRGMMRAAVARLRGQGLEQGASTITQQIVRNFLLPKERTLQRKVQEVALAIQLEKLLSKEKLLEIYANSLFLGNGSYGVGAAAYRYFGKKVEELAPHEAALIAGLFQSPSRYNPVHYPKKAKQRQLQVIDALAHAKLITLAQARAMRREPIVYREYHPINTASAPYFLDYVHEQAQKLLSARGGMQQPGAVSGQGLRIYTTLDSRLQRIAEKSIADSQDLLDAAQERTGWVKDAKGKLEQSTLEAALLSVDPRSGDILAMVGGRDYAKTKFNRTWQALRSPGSAFKPVVYSLALASKWRWSDMLYVSPVTINNYRPHTPDQDMLTETSLLRAFYRSMNTPTIELGQKLGLKPVIEQAQRLGIRSPIKPEFGSMLGSSDVTMLDMARMYGTFANQGKLVEPLAIAKILDRHGKVLYRAPAVTRRTTEAVTPQIAFLLTQGMRAVLQMGTGFGAAHLANAAVGKTGTSNESTDNWFCGYAPNLTTIVWVGTDEHAQIYGDATGGKLALPIWDKFMTSAFRVRPPTPAEVPSGVVTAVVNPRYGNRSAGGIRMYFLRGNEPEEESSALEVLSQSQNAGYRDFFMH